MASLLRKLSPSAPAASWFPTMEQLLGLLKVRVVRGVKLAVRDILTSDPYVVLKMDQQKLKTRVVKKNINPEWNEYLTLSISEPITPIHLMVYDKDTFSRDDKMGDAKFDINPFLEAVRMNLEGVKNGTVIQKVAPNRQNCLAEESSIVFLDGKVVQYMCLRLKNVECGEVEIQLEWVDVPDAKGIY